MATITIGTDYREHTCHSGCGKAYAIPVGVENMYRENHESFYCPYCKQIYHYPGKSDIEEANERANAAEKESARERARRAHVEDQRDYVERRRRAEKGARTRLKRKIAKGLCPSCGEEHPNLAKHMSTKHPDYGTTE